MSSPKIITIKNLSFAYQRENNILENISLEVFSDDFLGIIGPNGGGKTTLLKIILGLLKADQGNISVFNKKPKEARDSIGYVPIRDGRMIYGFLFVAANGKKEQSPLTASLLDLCGTQLGLSYALRFTDAGK